MDSFSAKKENKPSSDGSSRSEVLRKLINIPQKDGTDSWELDDFHTPPYRFTFENFLEKLGFRDFNELVLQKSKEAKRDLVVIDLFGGAHFLDNLNHVSHMIGVRLVDHDSELLDNIDHAKSNHEKQEALMQDPKRKIIEGNLYEGATWRDIRREIPEGADGYDLVVCRPMGAFGKSGSTEGTINSVQDDGLAKHEILAGLLDRALSLLAPGGMLFTELVNLRRHRSIQDDFWKEYISRKVGEGYKFEFADDQLHSNGKVLLVTRT